MANNSSTPWTTHSTTALTPPQSGRHSRPHFLATSPHPCRSRTLLWKEMNTPSYPLSTIITSTI